MNRKLKAIIAMIFTLILLSLANISKANTIDKISMDIFIDDNGTAKVTEIWNCSTSQGTEVYHPYYNLKNSKITNLKVSENGEIYNTLSSWNTSGTLDSKANKCGINYLSNGVELCWGMSSYGKHSYIVEYNITNFVSELNDSQMVYWTLIPHNFSNRIENVYIKIYSNKYIEDTVDVWGYGNYGGTAYVYDGYIEMQSDGVLDKNEYMTILVKFPKGTFNTTNKLYDNFEYYYNMAEEGTTHYNENKSNTPFFDVIMLILMEFFNILIVLMPFIIIFGISKLSDITSFSYGDSGKDIPKDISYYRDIPCNKDLYRTYYIAEKYGILKNTTDLLGAIILKWLKEGKIKIEQRKVGKIFKKEDTVIVLKDTNTSEINNKKEKKLFIMLKEASKDGILENKEFEKWCNNNYSTILSWFDNILKEEEKKLINEGYIIYEETKELKIFRIKRKVATPKLKEKAIEIAGLKKYLLEYTLIADREAIEVNLFEEYLILAQMMGIAKTVAKEFEKLYPKIIKDSSYYSYDNIIFIQTCSNYGISKAYSAKSRAESYSSGGGGRSSGGGGGGSFGGGSSGGGGFR